MDIFEIIGIIFNFWSSFQYFFLIVNFVIIVSLTFDEFSGLNFFLSIVLFNKEYTYLVNIIVLLLFLGLKTHTFTEFTRLISADLEAVLNHTENSCIVLQTIFHEN